MAFRATRQWIGEQLAFLVVIAALIAAFGYLVTSGEHPIRGTLAIAAVALLAAVLRLVLPTLSAGWLVVRGRFVDVVFYALFGGLIVLTDIRLKH